MDIVDRARFAFSVDKSLLAKATSDDENPTPGYMYNDIAKITFKSPQACTDVEDFLLRRMQRDSPMIRVKVLRLLKYLLANASDEFRTSIARRQDPIKACLHFRAPPDPVTGDAIPSEVRNLASEIMNMLYERTDARGNRGTASSRTAGRIVGMGSNGHASRPGDEPVQPTQPSHYGRGGGAPATLGTGRRMEGFGNPAFAGVRPPSPTFGERVAEAATSFVGRHVQGTGVAQQGTSQYSAPPPGFAGGGSSYDTAFQPRLPTGTGRHVRGKPGGGWGDADQPAALPARAASRHSPAPALPDRRAEPPRVARDDPGEYESQLVDAITAPGGVRSVPTREALGEFMASCRTLDTEVVGELLLEKLEDEDAGWQTMLKALHVIHALLKHDTLGTAYTAFYREDPSVLESLEAAGNPKVRVKAQAVCAMLRGQHAPEPQPRRHAPAPRPTAATTETLLDLGAAPRAHEEEEEEEDMFCGLSVSEAPRPALPPRTAPQATVEDLMSLGDDDDEAAMPRARARSLIVSATGVLVSPVKKRCAGCVLTSHASNDPVERSLRDLDPLLDVTSQQPQPASEPVFQVVYRAPQPPMPHMMAGGGPMFAGGTPYTVNFSGLNALRDAQAGDSPAAAAPAADSFNFIRDEVQRSRGGL